MSQQTYGSSKVSTISDTTKWILGGIGVLAVAFISWSTTTMFSQSEQLARLETDIERLEADIENVDALATFKFEADKQAMGDKLDLLYQHINGRDQLLTSKLEADRKYRDDQIDLVVTMLRLTRECNVSSSIADGGKSQ